MCDELLNELKEKNETTQKLISQIANLEERLASEEFKQNKNKLAEMKKVIRHISKHSASIEKLLAEVESEIVEVVKGINQAGSLLDNNLNKIDLSDAIFTEDSIIKAILTDLLVNDLSTEEVETKYRSHITEGNVIETAVGRFLDGYSLERFKTPEDLKLFELLMNSTIQTEAKDEYLLKEMYETGKSKKYMADKLGISLKDLNKILEERAWYDKVSKQRIVKLHQVYGKAHNNASFYYKQLNISMESAKRIQVQMQAK